MVEETIEKYSGEYKKKELWKKLPKKVMWQTFSTTIDYLESINKIARDKNGTLGYIWCPEVAKRFKHMKPIKIE